LDLDRSRAILILPLLLLLLLLLLRHHLARAAHVLLKVRGHFESGGGSTTLLEETDSGNGTGQRPDLERCSMLWYGRSISPLNVVESF
jgi:hypothetical protein